MAKETNLSSLESNIETSIKEYSELPLPNDCDKLRALQILTKELALVTSERKRIFDQKLAEDRFELEKDDKYWREKFEEEKFNKEQALAERRLALEEDRQKELLVIDTTRLQIEQARLDIERTNLELNIKKANDDKKYRYLQLALTIGIPALTSLVSLLVYRKLAYSNLKLIYMDEGRPTTDFKDAVKSIKNLTK